jgi:hypothetical protein
MTTRRRAWPLDGQLIPHHFCQEITCLTSTGPSPLSPLCGWTAALPIARSRSSLQAATRVAPLTPCRARRVSSFNTCGTSFVARALTSAVFLFDWPGFRPAVGARLQPFFKRHFISSYFLNRPVHKYAILVSDAAAACGAGMLEAGLPLCRSRDTFEPRRGRNQFGGFGRILAPLHWAALNHEIDHSLHSGQNSSLRGRGQNSSFGRPLLPCAVEFFYFFTAIGCRRRPYWGGAVAKLGSEIAGIRY